jgi:hypothetical protein
MPENPESSRNVFSGLCHIGQVTARDVYDYNDIIYRHFEYLDASVHVLVYLLQKGEKRCTRTKDMADGFQRPMGPIQDL